MCDIKVSQQDLFTYSAMAHRVPPMLPYAYSFHNWSSSQSQATTCASAGDSGVLTDFDSDCILENAICTAILETKHCASFVDPTDKHEIMKTVSEAFVSMTGYAKDFIVGHSSRFLNGGCSNDPAELAQLRLARQSGAPATVVLENRKASGEVFRQLLHVRGLTVCSDEETGENVWYLIAVHKDITDLDDGEDFDRLRDDVAAELEAAAEEIRAEVAQEVAKAGLEAPAWM